MLALTYRALLQRDEVLLRPIFVFLFFLSVATDQQHQTSLSNESWPSLESDVMSQASALLEYEHGTVYLQVVRGPAKALENSDPGGGNVGKGWVEVWQEGYRLLLNATDDEISFGLFGGDTYLWARIFDSSGRWTFAPKILVCFLTCFIERIEFDETFVVFAS